MEISYKDFQKLDIRIGTVKEAKVPKWSHWVMRLKVDLGEEIGEKIVFAGIMKFFKPKDLVGRQFPFIVNLEPKNIGPEKEQSQAMMLMAAPKDDEETPPVIFSLESEAPNGTKVR